MMNCVECNKDVIPEPHVVREVRNDPDLKSICYGMVTNKMVRGVVTSVITHKGRTCGKCHAKIKTERKLQEAQNA